MSEADAYFRMMSPALRAHTRSIDLERRVITLRDARRRPYPDAKRMQVWFEMATWPEILAARAEADKIYAASRARDMDFGKRKSRSEKDQKEHDFTHCLVEMVVCRMLGVAWSSHEGKGTSVPHIEPDICIRYTTLPEGRLLRLWLRAGDNERLRGKWILVFFDWPFILVVGGLQASDFMTSEYLDPMLQDNGLYEDVWKVPADETDPPEIIWTWLSGRGD